MADSFQAHFADGHAWWWDRRRRAGDGRAVLVTGHCLARLHWPPLCKEGQGEDAPVKIHFQGPVTSLPSPQMLVQDNIPGHFSGTFHLLLCIEGKH